MRHSKFFIAMCAYLACGLLANTYAQAPPPNQAADQARMDNSANNVATSQQQLRQLDTYINTARSFNRKDIKEAPTKEEVIKRADELISAIKVSCSLSDAQLVGLSTETKNNAVYQTSSYEVACTNGMGYFLTSFDRLKKAGAKPGPAQAANVEATTCMSADAVHDTAIAKGEVSDFFCQLPDNGGGDLKGMGERLLAAAGVNCTVSQFKWFGVKQESKIEVTEAACSNGTGYLLQTALPGGTATPTAMDCVEASRKGLDCKMTPVMKRPTLATFKDYLATTDTKCKIDNYDQVRVIGQESIKQRYVIEFRCSEQPNGLVAYIPLEGNSNPFEAIDCIAAKKRGMSCKLTTVN